MPGHRQVVGSGSSEHDAGTEVKRKTAWPPEQDGLNFGNCSPPPGSIEIMFIKGLSIQAGSEPILSILERSAWGGIRGHVLK